MPSPTPLAHPAIQPRTQVLRVPLGPFETNCYVVWHPPRPSCWIIDAGFDPAPLIAAVRAHHLQPEALILTHAHADHIAGVDDVLAAFPGLPVWMHADEGHWLQSPRDNLSAMMGVPISLRTRPAGLLTHGQDLTLADSRWQVRHTPGHSPGSIVLINERDDLALVGDTLFQGSVGRSDFPHSDAPTLAQSIRTQLYTLAPSLTVYPGHGPATSIGREARSNPFVRL